MSDDDLISMLTDPAPPPGPAAILVLPSGLEVDHAAEALELLLAGEPDVDVVELWIDGVAVGRTTRDFLGGPRRYIGAGDGATLPGPPARYRIIVLTCAAEDCDAVIRRIHVDESRLPACVNGHTSGWVTR
jgi:hypothetical protein